jgi:hypothetical protein
MTNLSGENMNFFQNDFEGYTFTSVETDILEVENSIDAISIHGSMTITNDKNGLQTLKFLLQLLEDMKANMEKRHLPDSISIGQTKPLYKDNPFN